MPKLSSAYGGKNFSSRNISSQNLGLDKFPIFRNEFKKLKKIVLYIPSNEINNLPNPDKVLHLEKINVKKLHNELKILKKFFTKNKIEIIEINRNKHIVTPPNLIFARDLFWQSPEGTIVSRMGSSKRANEELFIQKTLADNFYSIRAKVSSPATFEGADAIWINYNHLLIGIGNRTNKEAFSQLKKMFPQIKIDFIQLTHHTQHLLGILQITNTKKALVRTEIAPKKLINILKKNKYEIIAIKETEEVSKKQGMNIVVLDKDKIIMPDDCPELLKIYQQNKIQVIKTFKINELRKAAGGLACMTGILERLS